jgi:DNA-binding GntR family transcriptional regulator
VPGDGVAHAGLRLSRCDDGGFAKILRGFEQRIQSGSVDAIVVFDKEFHGALKLVLTF